MKCLSTIHFGALLHLLLIASLNASVLAADRPNVLFIAVDDLRPEIGCYGNKVVKTPNLDRLAARGTVFNHAYCQQAVCSPSRSSLMTGRRPDATRVWDLETHFRVALPDCVTLPEHFKANGYHCAALGKIYHGGFEDGRSWSEPHWYATGRTVDTDPLDWTKRITNPFPSTIREYSAAASSGPGTNQPNGNRPAPRNAANKKKNGPAFEVSPKDDDQLPDGATAAEAILRLRKMKSQAEPFFLAVGFVKPHLPFVAPKKYWDLYDPKGIPEPASATLPTGAPEFAGHPNGELHNYQGVPVENPIPADFARTLRHGYYASVSYTDAQVGRLLDALQAEGLADNTVVVLWGDHGWQLGDHGLWHKHTNFELATRAPLIIATPKQSITGKRCDATVEFVDVYPTLAELCGLPVPQGLDGLSLKPFIDNPNAAAAKVAISQYPRAAGRPIGQLMGYSIRDARFRLTVWRERTGDKVIARELYDYQTDPDETNNVVDRPEHQEVIASLSKYVPEPDSSLSKRR